MSILIFAVIVLIVVALLVYAIDYLPLAAPFNGIVKFLIILVGVVVICQRAGVL
jgi:hypothetical protein